MSAVETLTLHPSAADCFCQAAHFWKGRVALYAILKSLGIGEGDAVVVPGYTCVVVPTAVHFLGGEPIYADIDPATYNVTLPLLRDAARDRQVKAVVVQHTYGIPADLGPILDWARENDVAVIEDCCHALGGRYRDASGVWQTLGTSGDAAFYSSQWSKPFTTGLGGWAVAKGSKLQQRLEEFSLQQCVSPGVIETVVLAAQVFSHKILFRPSLYWFAQDTLRTFSRWGLAVGSSETDELNVVMPDRYAKRMSRFQESLAESRAATAEGLIEHRRRLKVLYEESLLESGLPTLDLPDWADPVLLRYPVRVPEKSTILTEARRRHIELGDWFDHPLHPSGCNVAALGWRDGLCPEGEKAAQQVVNLPMHARIGPKQVLSAVRLLKEHCAGHCLS